MGALMDPETERDPAGEPRFRYHGVVIQNIFGALWVALGVGFSIFSLYVKVSGRERQHDAWLGVLLIGLAVIWLGILTLKTCFKTSREIVVDDDGIAALAFGRAWKFIPWSEIAAIERIRRPMVTEWNTWREGYEFVIHGRQADEIHLIDNITCLNVLLNVLNRYIEQYHIPLVAFDRGSDTRPKIRATTPDREERRRLLREGYKTILSSLTTK